MRRLNWCGRGERRRRSRRCGPKAQEFGFPDEEAAFALQFGLWNRIGDLGKAGDQPDGFAEQHSHEIKPGMGVCGWKTFWPSKDGWSAARIEEEIVVTATGPTR